jgi:hypothetical protein
LRGKEKERKRERGGGGEGGEKKTKKKGYREIAIAIDFIAWWMV